jgi:hypothetical protein
MEATMPITEIIRKLKAEGKLGDYVRVEDDDTIMLRVRDRRDGYRNYLRVRKEVIKYRIAKERAK